MMTKIGLPVLIATLSACATPSPRFFGVDPVEVSAGGARFAVYQRAEDVEALRISRTALPKESEVLLSAISAIERATGCPVRPKSVKGDQAIVTAKVDCHR